MLKTRLAAVLAATAALTLAVPAVSAQAASRSCVDHGSSIGCHVSLGGATYSVVFYDGSPSRVETYGAHSGSMETWFVVYDDEGGAHNQCHQAKAALKWTGQEYLLVRTCTRVTRGITVRLTNGSSTYTFGERVTS